DARGQRDLGAAVFHAILERADSPHVSGMCQHAPRIMFELVPLFEEVIAAMIPDGSNHLAMGDANLADMRRIDDQFSPVGQNWLEFVHALAARPKFVVHLWRARKNGVEWFVFARDVKLT